MNHEKIEKEQIFSLKWRNLIKTKWNVKKEHYRGEMQQTASATSLVMGEIKSVDYMTVWNDHRIPSVMPLTKTV